jgi:hypothetical protein
MNAEIFPYSEQVLPKGCEYPTEYLEVISKNPEIHPWWFISSKAENFSNK